MHPLQALHSRSGVAPQESTPLPPVLNPSDATRSTLETVLAVSAVALVGVIVFVAVSGQETYEKGADGYFRKVAR